jgi:dTDP-4-dehydrorhamnose reductase
VRILVIGAEGQVGTFFLQELAAGHQVFGTALVSEKDLLPLDIRDRAAVAKHVRRLQPEHIILTAAMTHVDRCEEFPAAAESINVQGTRHVVEACREIQAGLTFFSTDYIFDGLNGPYAEDDACNPQSVYARTKLEGERLVAEHLEKYLIIRPMFIFSYLPGSLNFFMQILQRAQKGDSITVPCDQIGNPTHAVNLVRSVGELIGLGCTGVYHIAGTTRLGKDDFARRILEKLGYDPQAVKSVTTPEFRQKAPRPLNSGLRVNKAQSVLKANSLWDLDTSLDYALFQMAEAKQTGMQTKERKKA